MKPILRLCLGAGALSAWSVQAGKPCQIGSFPETPSGVDDFSRFLTRQPAAGHLLLLDHAEPRLLAETLPATGFLAYRRMLDLRLGRLYPDTRWRCALPLPAPPVGGRSVAFLALPESPALQGWLNCLAAAPIRLLGVHCAPLLLAPFLARQQRLPPRLVVVSQHERATRLSLLQRGRLAALALEAQTPAEEISEAIAHFSRCNPATEAAPDALCLLGTADWQSRIEVPGKALRIVTRHPDSNIDLLALPAWRWPRPRFPTPSLPHQDHRRIGRALWLAGTAAGLGGLAVTLAAQSTQNTLNADLERTRSRLLSLEREIREQEASATKLGLTTDQLPQLAGDRHVLAARRDACAGSLRQLAAALDETPGIDLDALEWASQADGAATGEDWQMQLGGRLSPDAAAAPTSLLQQLNERLRSRGMRAEGNTAPGTGIFSLRLTADRK